MKNQVFNLIVIAAVTLSVTHSQAADAVRVSPVIVEKYEKLNALRESSGLDPADRGNSCWVYQGKTNEGETRQACVVFIGQQRCVISNYRGLRCGASGREADCKIKKTGDLRCDNNVGLVKVSKKCFNNEYGEKVCSAGPVLNSGRLPASVQKKRNR